MDIKNSKTCQTCKRDFDLNKYVPLKLPCNLILYQFVCNFMLNINNYLR